MSPFFVGQAERLKYPLNPGPQIFVNSYDRSLILCLLLIRSVKAFECKTRAYNLSYRTGMHSVSKQFSRVLKEAIEDTFGSVKIRLGV